MTDGAMAWYRSAMRQLRAPETFGALPSRGRFDRLLCFWRFPSFEPFGSWSLFRHYLRAEKRGEYVVRRLECYIYRDHPLGLREPDIFGAEAPVPAKTAEAVLASFGAVETRPFGQPLSVVDGCRNGIAVGGQLDSEWDETRVTWMEGCVDGCRALDALLADTIVRFNALLPASSLEGQTARGERHA